MKRREFITLLGGAAVTWPLAARAQQPGKRPIIGFLGDSTALGESERAAAFARRLHDLGWIEGRTIAIEYRWADGRSERLAEIAAEFARLNVDIIVTGGTPAVIAAKQAAPVAPSCSQRRGTRSPRVSSQLWHGPVGTSPAYQH